jgi:hypothetical protein
MKIKILASIVTISLCIYVVPYLVFSQTPSASTRLAPKYDTLPFKVEGNRLPPNYAGHDFRKIYQLLKERNTPKENSKQRLHTSLD